ncbi:hypothetical protein Tco_0448576 [Tanacetum coccineum]
MSDQLHPWKICCPEEIVTRYRTTPEGLALNRTKPSLDDKHCVAALAMKIQIASIRATGANDSLKSIPSSYPLESNNHDTVWLSYCRFEVLGSSFDKTEFTSHHKGIGVLIFAPFHEFWSTQFYEVFIVIGAKGLSSMREISVAKPLDMKFVPVECLELETARAGEEKPVYQHGMVPGYQGTKDSLKKTSTSCTVPSSRQRRSAVGVLGTVLLMKNDDRFLIIGQFFIGQILFNIGYEFYNCFVEEPVLKFASEILKTSLSNEYDFIQARIEADRLLALRLQDEEREQFTVEERAKFLHDTIAAQRRFLAEQRAIAIRNKPPTRTQLRNQMMTYLKHVGNKKHSDLKNKTFEDIQALYEKVKRFDESFTAVGSTKDERRIKEMNEGVKDPDQKSLKKRVVEETPKKEDTTKVPAKVDVTEQGTKKRKGGHIKMLARKRKRPQSDVDSDDEHRKCLKIVTFEGTIDSEIMERKSVIARLNKRLYEACGVYILELKDGTIIHMLVERRYPLSKDLLQRMLNLGLEVERESTAALDLIRFIKQQIGEE